MNARIAELFRYPVKGLSPEPVTEAALEAGRFFPVDRVFAVENGPSGFSSDAPEHLPKIKFLMLMRNERLALFRSRYDAQARRLTVTAPDGRSVEGDPFAQDDRARFDRFFAETCTDALRGPPRLLVAPEGHRFVDSRRGFVSLLNLASVGAIEGQIGRPVDPLRFRANIHMQGLEPWQDFDLVGKRIAIGGATFTVLSRIVRCAATEVDPSLGLRDIRMLELLQTRFGHSDCGIYLKTETPGRIRPGDVLEVIGDAPEAPAVA
jgi:uncharacterized protein YcbX